MAEGPASPAPGGGAARPPRPSLMPFITIGILFFIIFNPALYTLVGHYVGFALDPVFGFGGRWPVLTIMLAGAFMVLCTTLVRHFTTDWLETAKFQAYQRAFQKEFMKARKENNTYRMKKLQDQQPEMLAKMQEVQAKQMRNMPITMLVVIPLFAWLLLFMQRLDYWKFTAPWHHDVDMFANNGFFFGSSVFPHWVLLYMTLSIPLGALIQKAMKYAAWKERWQKRHPEVHEE